MTPSASSHISQRRRSSHTHGSRSQYAQPPSFGLGFQRLFGRGLFIASSTIRMARAVASTRSMSGSFLALEPLAQLAQVLLADTVGIRAGLGSLPKHRAPAVREAPRAEGQHQLSAHARGVM